MKWRRHQAARVRPLTPCGRDLGPNRTWVVELEGARKASLETGRTRLIVAALVFAVAFLAIGLRIVELAVLQEGHEPRVARSTTSGEPWSSGRAQIVDRNGTVLATSLPIDSLFANPQLIRNPERAAALLTRVLPEISRAELVAKLSTDRSFVWIKRDLTPRQAAEINRLGLVGVDFQREERRIYPHGALTSHVVGFTDIDGNGLAGMERAFDDLLTASDRPLQLSLDLRVQHILAEELGAAMEEFRAIGAAGVVMDVHSGEVVAMTSLPSFDPNRPGEAPADARFNRATLGVYEMGSVFKTFTLAEALDTGAIRLNDSYDVTDPIRIGRFRITDYHPIKGKLSIPEIFMESSNIGTVKVALEAGTEAQQRYFGALGLLRAASLELPEVGQPITPSPWREVNTMTASYGHGIAVTPVQVARAIAAVVNGGELLPPTLIKRLPGETAVGERVFSPSTSASMRWLLRLVVAGGTGRNGEAPGYMVGGKTGTADKLNPNGGYARNKRIASFVGAFPMHDPRYVVFAMVDEPKPSARSHGFATAGWVAAPVVGKTISRMAPLLGISPAPLGAEAALAPDPRLIPAALRGKQIASH